MTTDSAYVTVDLTRQFLDVFRAAPPDEVGEGFEEFRSAYSNHQVSRFWSTTREPLAEQAKAFAAAAMGDVDPTLASAESALVPLAIADDATERISAAAVDRVAP